MSEKEAEAEKSDLTLISVVTEAEKLLARTSYQDFYHGKYIECVQSLLKLVNSRPSDPKVMHNKAVVEYYLSDFKRTDEFKKNLQHVCNQANVILEDIDSLDDVEHCVLYYNNAVLLYHLRQYHAALIIMDRVFQFIEPLEDNLARKVCFLLLELYLCTYQPEKALGMINFIEAMLFESQSCDNGSKSQTSEKEKDEAESSMKEVTKEALHHHSDNEPYRPKLQQQKARCYLMLRSLKGCKRELKNLMNSSGMVPATVYLKANLEYMRGNHRKAIKVLNTAPSQSRPFVETGENVPVLFYNNMGCIHFYMGRPNLGCLYFQKALQENESAIKRLIKPDQGVNGRPIYTVGANFRYELLYNLGIQLLHAKKPKQAFDCLIEAVQVYQMNPRLWLRLAECCIQLHQHDNEVDFRLKEKKKDMIQGVVGSGPHRKILLAPSTHKAYQIGHSPSWSTIPAPTLEFASAFLKNAMILLPEDASIGQSSNKSPEELDSNQVFDNILIAAPPGNPIKGPEIASLRCSILAASAYVALNIGDILMALHYAETLLAQPKLSGGHKFLGHLYAGEAMILLDRIADAVQQLNPLNIKEISFTFPPLEREDKDRLNVDAGSAHDLGNKVWFPSTAAVARMVMQYNLTVAYTVRGELDKASDTLKQLNNAKGSGTDIPIQAMMLAMYIQMQFGHADVAKSMIRQNFPQYR